LFVGHIAGSGAAGCFEKAGVIFVDENGEGAGVRLRKSFGGTIAAEELALSRSAVSRKASLQSAPPLHPRSATRSTSVGPSTTTLPI
jgi:hypothetical protein